MRPLLNIKQLRRVAHQNHRAGRRTGLRQAGQYGHVQRAITGGADAMDHTRRDQHGKTRTQRPALLAIIQLAAAGFDIGDQLFGRTHQAGGLAGLQAGRHNLGLVDQQRAGHARLGRIPFRKDGAHQHGIAPDAWRRQRGIADEAFRHDTGDRIGFAFARHQAFRRSRLRLHGGRHQPGHQAQDQQPAHMPLTPRQTGRRGNSCRSTCSRSPATRPDALARRSRSGAALRSHKSIGSDSSRPPAACPPGSACAA